ncbi:MAG TPA: AI-2E family transporter [Candidatus Faecousia excrementigallinarum]|uniref:AI-2E family transporter n=1 Tax=Candidatus Faecousia excrementigallinarum TaxID=2840806 RepID=A0A9D0Z1X9_9FIRM|nr:AI-2E family transporter [Candidatus Faecousia excrementigallinarum]
MELDKKNFKRLLAVVCTGIILYWLLNEPQLASGVWSFGIRTLSPFIVGAVIAFILNVPMRFFERHLKFIQKTGLRRSVALLLTLVCGALVITAVFSLLIPQLAKTIASLYPAISAFLKEVEAWVNRTLAENPQLMQWIQENTELSKLDWAGLVQQGLTLVGNSLSAILTTALTAIGGLVGVLMDAFIAIVFAVYALFQKEVLARQGRKLAYAFLKESHADYVVKVLRLSNATFSNFLSGQCIEVCILGGLFAVAMAIFRMPYIPLISVLVAVTAFIPVVGAWAGCIIGAFLILISDPVQAFWFVIMFLVIQQIEGNMIYPKVVGTSIGLSGMWVLFAIGIGGELMGVLGMFLMIPVVSVLYTLLREWTHNRLDKRDVAEDKLREQPPALVSRFKQKRQQSKAKREMMKGLKAMENLTHKHKPEDK